MRKVNYLTGVMALCLLFTQQVVAALPDFKALVKDASPAVVNISTIQNVSERTRGLPGPLLGPDGEEVPEIFRHFFRIPELQQAPRQQAPRSLGSGFIISDDGYVLTNYHVIKGADTILVRLSDRRELEAELIGSDERSDVALLKLDAENLPTVSIGKSRQLEVGEWVLAIGSPFGFDHSVTAGIVSATERALANETYVPFIQTDVAINPGNSGGPLFNLDGEVVGINSQIYTRSGGFMGLSFAIPIDVAMDVVNQIKNQGFVTRGWLGVIIQDVSRDLAESFGLDKPAGALVAKVLPDSPAAKAGLREGDVIYSFNGHAVNLSADLPHHVGRVKPGDEVEVKLIRQGERERLDVTIGVLPEDPAQARHDAEQQSRINPLNIELAELDSARKAKWNISSGVLVKRVYEGPGAAAGLVTGDVITMINGQRIESVRECEKLLADLPEDKAVPLRIVRKGSPMFIPLKLK